LKVKKIKKGKPDKKEVISEMTDSSQENQDPNILMKFVTQLNFNELNITPSVQKQNQDQIG
jgi:hypothetical protein